VDSIRRPIPDIQRWLPERWDQFVSNCHLKEYFQSQVSQLRTVYRETGIVPNTSRTSLLLTGESRSGKTSLIKFFVRCLTCLEVDEQTLNPCRRTCHNCREQAEKYGLEGLFATCAFGSNTMQVNFSVIDCTKIQTPEQLRSHLVGVNDWTEGLRIYYFDEIHRLVQRNMDEMLLKEVEEKNFMWIFSTAKPGDLEDMFLNRLLKFSTKLPTSNEMENWLADRCDEWGINWESWAVVRLVEKSNRVPGIALQALALAAIDPKRGLTLKLVEDKWVAKLDG
jgi:Cdc6-like AAA superfamily ATPase